MSSEMVLRQILLAFHSNCVPVLYRFLYIARKALLVENRVYMAPCWTASLEFYQVVGLVKFEFLYIG